MTPPGLLLVAHGTRSDVGTRASERLAAAVAAALPGVPVRLALVDVRPPTVADVLPGLLDLAGRAVVVPAFLASGYHVRKDLPGQLDAVGARDSVTVAPALGGDPLLVAATARRLRAAGLRPEDAVVLAAAGSSDPAARAEVRRVARALGGELGTRVRVGLMATGRQPRLAEVVAEAGRDGRRVAVASWLLAPGRFEDTVLGGAAEVRAPSLAGDPAVRDAVVARYRAAVREGEHRVA